MSTNQPADSAGDSGVEQVGGRIRATRRSRGLTLVQLAELASLSHPFLSQLERGLARPSFASLERIARALGTSQIELLGPERESVSYADGPAVEDVSEERPGEIGPADDRVIVPAGTGRRGRYGEGTARILMDGPRFRVLEFQGSNIDFGHAYRHAELEWIHVVSGRVDVELDGQVHALSVGDSAECRPGVAHRWRSPEAAPYSLLIVKDHRRHG